MNGGETEWANEDDGARIRMSLQTLCWNPCHFWVWACQWQPLDLQNTTQSTTDEFKARPYMLCTSRFFNNADFHITRTVNIDLLEGRYPLTQYGQLEHLLVTISHPLLSGNKAKWHYVLSVPLGKYLREIHCSAWKMTALDFLFWSSVYLQPTHTPSTCTFQFCACQDHSGFLVFLKLMMHISCSEEAGFVLKRRSWCTLIKSMCTLTTQPSHVEQYEDAMIQQCGLLHHFQLLALLSPGPSSMFH